MIVEQKRQVLSQRGILVAGLILTGLYVAGLMWLATFGSYNTSVALLIAPVLVALSLPVLAREARREGDRTLFWILVAALVIKLAASLSRYWVDFVYYHGSADAAGYYGKGLALADQFRGGVLHLNLHSYAGSSTFTYIVSAAVLAIIGPSKLGGFLVFSWIGFWGLYFFYRAFVVAVPEGRRRQYAALTFFMPTLLFWPSEIGKEAWMMLALGLAAYGAASALTKNPWRGLLAAALGLWFASLVRPHMAAMLGLAIAVGFLVRKPKSELRQLAPVVKAAGLVVVGILAFLLVRKASAFLAHAGVTVSGGLTQAVDQLVSRTGGGGSGFEPSILTNPVRAPLDIITVLYRPLLFEANSITSLAAALETTFLLVLTVVRLGWIGAAVRSVRRQPYVAVAIAYTIMFLVAFSVFANYGTLVRERSQLLPLFFVLLCVPPRRRRSDA